MCRKWKKKCAESGKKVCRKWEKRCVRYIFGYLVRYKKRPFFVWLHGYFRSCKYLSIKKFPSFPNNQNNQICINIHPKINIPLTENSPIFNLKRTFCLAHGFGISMDMRKLWGKEINLLFGRAYKWLGRQCRHSNAPCNLYAWRYR